MATELPKFSKELILKKPGQSWNQEEVSRDNHSQNISDQLSSSRETMYYEKSLIVIFWDFWLVLTKRLFFSRENGDWAIFL